MRAALAMRTTKVAFRYPVATVVTWVTVSTHAGLLVDSHTVDITILVVTVRVWQVTGSTSYLSLREATWYVR